MAKKSALEKIETTLPDINQVSAPVIEGEISEVALRRQKVRELHRMGFDPKRISMILGQGIKGRDGKPIKVPCSEDTIKNDLGCIAQESLAEDESYLAKRADVLDKLRFIYNQAMLQFRNAKNSGAKNSFLNTAITILGKITEIEGLTSPQQYQLDVRSESKSLAVADEIRTLSQEEKDAVISTIRTVLEKGSKLHRPAGNLLLPREPRVPTPSSDDAGVPGKPRVHSRRGRTKTSQQKGTN